MAIAVIGGGVAGIHAALTLANSGYKDRRRKTSKGQESRGSSERNAEWVCGSSRREKGRGWGEEW